MAESSIEAPTFGPDTEHTCAHCGERVWKPGNRWLHWATSQRPCNNVRADAEPIIAPTAAGTEKVRRV